MSRRDNLGKILLGFILIGLINLTIFIPGGFLVATTIAPILNVLAPMPSTTTLAQGWSLFCAVLSSIWLYQLLYVIPLVFFFKQRREIGLMKGTIVGAILTALIAGSCFIYFLTPLL